MVDPGAGNGPAPRYADPTVLPGSSRTSRVHLPRLELEDLRALVDGLHGDLLRDLAELSDGNLDSALALWSTWRREKLVRLNWQGQWEGSIPADWAGGKALSMVNDRLDALFPSAAPDRLTGIRTARDALRAAALEGREFTGAAAAVALAYSCPRSGPVSPAGSPPR